MLAVVLSALLIAAAVVTGELREQNELLLAQMRVESNYRDLIDVAEAVEMYYLETANFPTSLSALASTAGYQHVASSVNNFQGMVVSPNIADTVWTYKRAVVYSLDKTTGETPASYLSSNDCGTGGYDTAASWCASKSKPGRYYRKETREALNEQITTARVRLNRLTQKFANYYNANQKYPDVDASNVALAAESITSLAALVGYAGTAANCSGQFQYQGVPIDCSDMFDFWGGAIGYQFVSNQHIILVSETPLYNSTGNRIVIAADRA